MDIYTITGLAVVAAALAALLRAKTPEFALLLSVALGVLVISVLLSQGAPLFERIRTLLEATNAQSQAIQILFKALAICFVVQIACDACRDMGESAMASKVELAGKISVLVISLPLFEGILQIVGNLMGQ